MTVSSDKRHHNLNEALIRMTEDVGETPLYKLDFEAKSDRFKDILATTWYELMESGYAKWRWQDTYNLTVEGWTEGMIFLELHKQPEFEAKLQKLMGTLKDQIKGRDDYEAYLPLEQAAAESGVSQELIRNVLEGRFIEKALGRIGAKLDTDHVIVIRRRFGRPGKRPPTPALQDLEDKYRNRSAQTGESEAAQRGVTVAPGEAGPPTKSATPGGVGGTAAGQAAKIITPTVEYQLGSIGRLAWVHVLAMDIPSGALVIFADDLVQLYNDKKIPDFSI